MRTAITVLCVASGASALAQQPPAPPDTATIIAAIEQRMAQVDRAPIGAVYLIMRDGGTAVPLRPDSAVQGDPIERDELYLDPLGGICGVGSFFRSAHQGIVERSMHYFDANGSTIAASWELRWDKSGCTDSIAVETRYAYFYPAGSNIARYVTLNDGMGRPLDFNVCRFPDIERHFEAYYTRDDLLHDKHITLP